MKIFVSCLAICLFISCNSESTKFELCGGGLYPYYHPQLNYEGSFYAIKEHFYTNYKAVDSGSNNGIVKIRFHVNCNGETGNFKTETYGFDYNSNEMDSQITQQLLALTQELENWIPAKDENGEALNSHKFFAFKIRDGQLTDILPK
tara:strand:+ start:5064 stop:5504 length:441 start_codon:yes stop_codon:yes gene_type:complete